jgi:glycosyltransferase involved in cell wall biosynthesis
MAKYARRVFGFDAYRNLWKPAVPQRVEPEEPLDPDVVNYRPDQGRWFARHGPELMLYPAPSNRCFEAGIPYVVALHHMDYRLHEASPHALERYEYMIRNTIRYATLIIVDSEALKGEILNRFHHLGPIAESIRVLPSFAASYLEEEMPDDELQPIFAKYGVEPPYALCPAAYEPHKNHRGLLDALDILETEYALRVPVVTCGPSSGERNGLYREIMEEVESRGRSDQVRCLPYVPDQDLSAFYIGARLVCALPLLGTSSFVPPEAWAFGRPILASGLPGFRDQIGDAGMLVDAKSAPEIADGIRRLWTEGPFRENLVDHGRRKSRSFTAADFAGRLIAILGEAWQIMESQSES